jgi:hypothetical protein
MPSSGPARAVGREVLAARAEGMTLKPSRETTLLVPSSVYHPTIPYETDQQRISIAFDVLPAE